MQGSFLLANLVGIKLYKIISYRHFGDIWSFALPKSLWNFQKIWSTKVA
jgi:hypothetical protein